MARWCRVALAFQAVALHKIGVPFHSMFRTYVGGAQGKCDAGSQLVGWQSSWRTAGGAACSSLRTALVDGQAAVW